MASGRSGPPSGPINNPRPPTQYDPEVVRQFIEQQGKELDIRQQEVVLQTQQLKQSGTFAEKSLEAQERDRRHAREERRKGARERYGFALVVVIVFAAVLAYAIQAGQAELAKELVKDALIALGGGGAGFAVAKSNKNNDPPKQGGDGGEE